MPDSGSKPTPLSRERGTSLRLRLVLGLALAVSVPFLLFTYVGDLELRRRAKEDLGRYLLSPMARGGARRIADWLQMARSNAETFCATSDLRRAFDGGPRAMLEFESFYSRVSEVLGDLGDLLLIDHQSDVLFLARDGIPIPRGGEDVDPEVLETWLGAVEDGQIRFFPPAPDPLAGGLRVSAPLDPEQYVMPLLVPIRSDTQVARGACVFLLPFGAIQDEIEQTRRELVDEAGIRSGEVYLVDRASSRYVLHTNREQIGKPAELPNLEDFTEEDGGSKVRAARSIEVHASLPWSVGVRADAIEIFRSVDNLSRFFLVLVLLVLGATLGIASLISLAATRSLRRLEAVTEELGGGDLSTRAPVAGPRETRKLARALNQMAAQLESERERLKQAERDRAWTEMARQVAHEIKNPLQPVKLHAELIHRLLASGLPDAVGVERGKASAAVILRQVEALRKIVGDFSAYAQAALPLQRRVRFPATQVMQELCQLYEAAGEEQGEVRFVDDSGEALLEGDPLRLQQVLVNLIKNAIEAIGASSGPADVEVEAHVHGETWLVEVRDRGEGLPEGGAAQAFEPSFSTKPGGTGLGLAICRRNVEAMGGKVELLPRPGGGAVARVELPLAPTAG